MNNWTKLGYINDWSKIPKKLQKCKKQGHMVGYYDNNGKDVYFCPICRIEYQVKIIKKY